MCGSCRWWRRWGGVIGVFLSDRPFRDPPEVWWFRFRQSHRLWKEEWFLLLHHPDQGLRFLRNLHLKVDWCLYCLPLPLTQAALFHRIHLQCYHPRTAELWSLYCRRLWKVQRVLPVFPDQGM